MSNEIQGKIIEVNVQGDLISDIPSTTVSHLLNVADVRVEVGEHFTLGIFSTDHSEPESTFVAVLGKNDCLELRIVGMSASEMLGIRVGEQVRVRW